MIIVDWNNTTDFKTALYANKGTTEDIVFRLTEDFTGVWDTASWSGFSTAGLTMTIDLNGFEIKPSAFLEFATFDASNKMGAVLFGFNDDVPGDLLYGDPYSSRGNYHATNGLSVFNGNVIIENGSIDIRGLSNGIGGGGNVRYAVVLFNNFTSVGYVGTLTFRRLDINMENNAPMFDTKIGQNLHVWSFDNVEMYSCVVNGGLNSNVAYNTYTGERTLKHYIEDCLFTGVDGYVFKNSVRDTYCNLTSNRVYTSTVKLAFGAAFTTNGFPTSYFIDVFHSGDEANEVYKRNIPFNETTFHSLAPDNELFLVPIDTSPLGDSANIGQTSIISSGLNTVGLNGIRSTDGDRVIGPMGMPIIVDGPTGMTMVYNSADITVSWIPDTDTSVTRTKIYLDEYQTGSFTNEIADVPVSTTSTTIPYSSLYQGKVSYIKLKHS